METGDGSFFVDWADGKPQLARSGRNLQVNLEVGFFADWRSLIQPPVGEWMKTQGQLLTFYLVGWERATDGGTVSLGKLMRVVWTHNYGKFWILWCHLYQNWTELRISGVIVMFGYFSFFFLLIYAEEKTTTFICVCKFLLYLNYFVLWFCWPPFFVWRFPPPACLWSGPTTQKTKKNAFKSIFPLPSAEQALGAAVAKHCPASSPVSGCVHVADGSRFVPVPCKWCNQRECGFCVCGDMFFVCAVGDICLVRQD